MTSTPTKSPMDEASNELESLVAQAHKETVRRFANLREVREEKFGKKEAPKSISESFNLLVAKIKESRVP